MLVVVVVVRGKVEAVGEFSHTCLGCPARVGML
jgi:hypothetical protein